MRKKVFILHTCLRFNLILNINLSLADRSCVKLSVRDAVIEWFVFQEHKEVCGVNQVFAEDALSVDFVINQLDGGLEISDLTLIIVNDLSEEERSIAVVCLVVGLGFASCKECLVKASSLVLKRFKLALKCCLCACRVVAPECSVLELT